MVEPGGALAPTVSKPPHGASGRSRRGRAPPKVAWFRHARCARGSTIDAWRPSWRVCSCTACGDDEAATELHGSQVDPPFTVSSQELVDTDGEPFSLTADTGKRLTMVFFGYTNCPDICNIVLGNLSSAMTRLDEDDLEQVEVVFVTTDPERDTPDVVRAYLDRLRPRVHRRHRGARRHRDGGGLGRGRHGGQAAQRRLRGRRPHHDGDRHRRRRRGADLLVPGHLAVGVRRGHPRAAEGGADR